MSKLDEVAALAKRKYMQPDNRTTEVSDEAIDLLIRAVRQLEAVRQDTIHLRKWINSDLSALSKAQIIGAVSRMTTEGLFLPDPDVLELVQDG